MSSAIALADATGGGRPDIVGFGDHGVWLARALPGGGFAPLELVMDDMGYEAGGWRVERHPRFLADTTGDGRRDIVGFGNDSVWVARAMPAAAMELVIDDLGYNAGGWRVERHPASSPTRAATRRATSSASATTASGSPGHCRAAASRRLGW